MRSVKKIISLSILFLSCMVLSLNAQSQPIDFKYEKAIKDTNKIEIQVKILEGVGPFTYILYQGDPLEKGISLKKDETLLKDFTLSFENKVDLYLYISATGIGKQKSFKIVRIN
jgi:hypothetical protein